MTYIIHTTDGGELYHHGILGQKWEQRNGPPYPLNPEDHSKAEQAAAAGSYGSTKKSTKTRQNDPGLIYDGKRFYEEHKREIMLAAGITAVAVGATFVARNPQVQGLFSTKLKNLFHAAPVSVLNNTAVPKNATEELANKLGITVSDDIKNLPVDQQLSEVNTNLSTEARDWLAKVPDEAAYNNLSLKEKTEYIKAMNDAELYLNNCSYCTTVYELRMRGLDVHAVAARKVNIFGLDIVSGEDIATIKTYFKNTVVKTARVTNMKGLADYATNKFPNGSRGNVIVSFTNGGAHSMIFEIDNGKFIIRDGQLNKSYTTIQELSQAFDKRINFAGMPAHNLGGIKLIRTDNLELNLDAFEKLKICEV